MFTNLKSTRVSMVGIFAVLALACTPVQTSNELTAAPDSAGVVAVAFGPTASSMNVTRVTFRGLDKGTYILFRIPADAPVTRGTLVDEAAAFSCGPSRSLSALIWCPAPETLGENAEGVRLVVESPEERFTLEGRSIGSSREWTLAIATVEGAGITGTLPFTAEAIYSGDCGKPKPKLESLVLSE